MKIQNPTLFFAITLFLVACKWEPVDRNKPYAGADNKSIHNTNIGRDIWQKPEKVIEKLGDISNKTIADIGAGTGYFTFRLAMNANNVIAIDIDQEMIELINAFKLNLPLELKDKIETRLATPMDPNLKANEADIIVMINTIMFIEDKDKYLSNIHQILPDGGGIMLVDYKSKNIPLKVDHGNYTISEELLIDKLKTIGYDSILVDDRSLEYQYMVYAIK